MMRFLRLLLFLFGITLFIITVSRTLQPARSERLYLTVYGSRDRDQCCFIYIANPDKNTAERVRVRVATDDNPMPIANSVSASGEWQIALVRTATTIRPYLVKRIRNQDQPPLLLDDVVASSQQLLWSAQEDRVYFLVRGQQARLALFMLLPEQPKPVRLSPDFFGYVRSLGEQPLPTTSFSPVIPLFFACNILLIAACLPLRRGSRAATPPDADVALHMPTVKLS